MWIIYRVILAVFVFSLMGLWYGFDKVRVSAFSSQLATFSTSQVIDSGIGDARYVQINDGVWEGTMVYSARKGKSESQISSSAPIESIIIPLFDLKQFAEIENFKNPKVAVLVKYQPPSGTVLKDLDNWFPENSKEYGDNLSVSGVTLVGFDSLDSKTKELVESMKYEVSENVVYLQAGEKPAPLYWGFGLLIVSFIGATGSPVAAYMLHKWGKKREKLAQIEGPAEITSLNLNGK